MHVTDNMLLLSFNYHLCILWVQSSFWSMRRYFNISPLFVVSKKKAYIYFPIHVHDMELYPNMFCGGGHLGFQIRIKHVFVDDLPRNI